MTSVINFFFFLSTVGLSILCFGKEEKKRKGGLPPGGSQISHGFHNFSGSVS